MRKSSVCFRAMARNVEGSLESACHVCRYQKVNDPEAADAQLVSPEVQALAQRRISQALQPPGAASGAVNHVGQGTLAQGATDPGQVLLLKQELDISQGVLLGRGIREESLSLRRRVPGNSSFTEAFISFSALEPSSPARSMRSGIRLES